MLDVRKSAKAERDLIDIWLYGYEQWGITEANLYAARIDEGLQRLRRQPGIGVDSRILPGLRRWKVGSHHIYYHIEAGCLHVARVLSTRQDASARLRE